MTKKVYILHDNPEWIPAIANALKNRDIEYEELLLDGSNIINLDSEPPEGVFYNRVSASSHTRGRGDAPNIAASILSWVESYGREVINGSHVINFEVSKIKQYAALKRCGIKIPKTKAIFSRSMVLDGAKNYDFPLIIKHNRGGKGIGVKLINSLSDLENYLNSGDYVDPVDGIILLQEYIKPKNDHIVRVEFIGREFFYAVKVDSSDGFNLCPADVCSAEGAFCPAESKGGNKFEIIKDFSDPIISQYQEFLNRYNIDVAGIEFVEADNGELYTYDINTNTNYNQQSESCTGLSAYDKIAEFCDIKI